MEEQPHFVDEWLGTLIKALNEFAAGEGAELLGLVRDSDTRDEYRAVVLSMPAMLPAWQVPNLDPPVPIRLVGEAQDLVRVLLAQEAAASAGMEASRAQRAGESA